MVRSAAALICVGACTLPGAPGAVAIDRVEPASDTNTTEVAVRIVGRNFQRPVHSNIDNGAARIGEVAVAIGTVQLTGAVLRDESTLDGTVPAGLPVGLYDVSVQLGDRTDTLTAGYTVVDVMPSGLDAMPAQPSPFAMTGQRWLLPCLNNLGNKNCNCAPLLTNDQTLTGSSAERYVVTVRIRGVMEAFGYGGGTAGPGGWYVGGLQADFGNNVYSIIVSSPAQHYWLNGGTPTAGRSFLYDYTVSFPVDGDATLTYTAAGQDGLQWGNYDAAGQPITIPGVTTTPDPYDGQFAQLDVISAVLQ